MSNFSWEQIYKELSNKMLEDKNNDGKTILKILNESLTKIGIEENGISTFIGIDPFTFFVIFNGYIKKEEKRKKILSVIKKELKLIAAVPDDFDGIPAAGNPQKAWFTGGEESAKFKDERKILWQLFENAINYSDNGSSIEDFKNNFNKAMSFKNVSWRLTTVLYLIRPETYISLDSNSREKLKEDYQIDVKNDYKADDDSFVINGEKYIDLCLEMKKRVKDFKTFSLDAWKRQNVNTNDTNGLITANNKKLEEYKEKLKKAHNMIFRGAPGTGKTYLSKQLATYIVSDGKETKYESLNDEEKEQIEFVQFHPSYDYTDFVEGIRPNKENGFELVPGIFKRFVEKALSCDKVFVFIIDEINRGEISKIFGELFFSIDPGYRGIDGSVSTQYSNMHTDVEEKFYIPENVYIIGTMNDIDRSVDTFDFAMKRRFAFVPITAKDSQIMLTDKKIINRMNNLNEEILKIDGLNENYQIGASYFRRLEKNELDEKELWDYYLKPLLEDYMQGMEQESIRISIENLKKAYDNGNSMLNNEQE